MRYTPVAIRAGIFSGVGAALWTLFEYAMGWHNEHLETGAMTGFVAVIFPVAALIWALRTSKRSQAGRLTLAQALMCGMAVSAVGAAIGIVFFYVYYTAINPAFIDAMAARGVPVDVTEQLVAVALGSFVFGILFSAIAGMVMRTREGAAL